MGRTELLENQPTPAKGMGVGPEELLQGMVKEKTELMDIREEQ